MSNKTGNITHNVNDTCRNSMPIKDPAPISYQKEQFALLLANIITLLQVGATILPPYNVIVIIVLCKCPNV